MNPTRESVATALFNLLKTTPGIVWSTRRPVLWDDAPSKPALCMGNSVENYAYPNGTATPAIISIDFDIFIYFKNAMDPNVTPDTPMNTLMDAFENTLAGPAFNNFFQTLGGLVNHAWIEGAVHRAPGYLDGQGMVLLTIRVLVP